MRDESPTSSAIPDDLTAYARGTRDAQADFRVGPLARVRSAIAEFLSSCPDYGAEGERLDGPLSVHLEHSAELAAWVEAVASAFFEAGSGRVRHSRTHDPDDPGWDGAARWTADDDALARQVRADSAEAQALRVEGARLADRTRGDAGNLDAIRADMAELDRNCGDIIFTAAFFNRLGPQMTLWLEREIVDFSHYARYSGWENDPFTELLRPLDTALATATLDAGLTSQDHLRPSWISDLIGLEGMRAFDLSNLLQVGSYSTAFLVIAGRRVASYTEMDLAFGGYPNMVSDPAWRGTAATWGDPLVAILAAIGRDPEACGRLLADRQVANKLLSIRGDAEQQLVADIVRAATEAYPTDPAQQASATMNVLQQFDKTDHAPAEIRHVLSELVALHIKELGLDADIQTGRPSSLNPDGTMYLALGDLDHVLRLATRDEADSARVLAASSAWAADRLRTGTVDAGTIEVGRWYGSLVRANDTRVTDAAADDARRHQFMDSLDKVIGLIPVPGAGELAHVGGEGVKLMLGKVIQGALGPDQADAAAAGANSFNDDMAARLDYLAAAAAFARDPGRLSAGVPAPVLVVDGGVVLAPPERAGYAYQLWLAAHSGDLNAARGQILAGYASRKPEFAGR